jgi:hypothetical protein
MGSFQPYRIEGDHNGIHEVPLVREGNRRFSKTESSIRQASNRTSRHVPATLLFLFQGFSQDLTLTGGVFFRRYAVISYAYF